MEEKEKAEAAPDEQAEAADPIKDFWKSFKKWGQHHWRWRRITLALTVIAIVNPNPTILSLT